MYAGDEFYDDDVTSGPIERHSCMDGDDCALFDVDPLITATIEVEKRQDVMHAAAYALHVAKSDPNFSLAWAVEYAGRDLGKAWTAFWIEATAAGLVWIDEPIDPKLSEQAQAEIKLERFVEVARLIERAFPEMKKAATS